MMSIMSDLVLMYLMILSFFSSISLWTMLSFFFKYFIIFYKKNLMMDLIVLNVIFLVMFSTNFRLFGIVSVDDMLLIYSLFWSLMYLFVFFIFFKDVFCM